MSTKAVLMPPWQPTGSLMAAKKRAVLYQKIRAFFAERQVLEVETPILSHFGITDPHIASVVALFKPIEGLSNQETCYLHTSPEYAMKRLLAMGWPDCYQLAKVFRNGEVGRFHNPEFTLLEWYRLGWNEQVLMQEVGDLIQILIDCPPPTYLSYSDAFKLYLKIDPLKADALSLEKIACDYQIGGAETFNSTDRDFWLALLMTHLIEPQIGQDAPIFIYDFPASQAALARLQPYDHQVAARFELYYQGLELANGFYELAVAEEQARRFQVDLSKRNECNLPPMPIDTRFLAALSAGLPPCAGVALGIDRVLMLALGAKHIDEVVTFSFPVA